MLNLWLKTNIYTSVIARALFCQKTKLQKDAIKSISSSSFKIVFTLLAKVISVLIWFFIIGVGKLYFKRLFVESVFWFCFNSLMVVTYVFISYRFYLLIELIIRAEEGVWIGVEIRVWVGIRV